MGGTSSVHKISFEDVQKYSESAGRVILINTLPAGDQYCLIPGTLGSGQEEARVNDIVKEAASWTVVIYGRNCNDDSVYEKYKQFIALGFPNVSIYLGGMFEWLCLQEIYGVEAFPTTSSQLDILKYKPPPRSGVLMLENGHP